MTWVLFTIICSLFAAWILYPIWSSTSQLILHLQNRKSELRKSLREQRASLLLSLRELDFDYEMGKLSPEDYKNLKERYQAKTVEVLKQLETIDAQWKTFQEEIDQELQRRYRGFSPASTGKSASPLSQICHGCGSQAHETDRFCRSCGSAVAQLCTSCGKRLKPNDRFCSSCGNVVKGAQPHA